MKKLYTLAICAAAACTLQAQVTLYNNDFSGGPTGWAFSTQNSINSWIVNSIYNCTTPTPNQGGGNYLHVYDYLFAADFCAFYNNYGAGSGDICYATMTAGINTNGQPGVIVTFDWLCAGQTGNVLPTYGFIDYSTNGGVTWTNITQPFPRYNGQATWTGVTINSNQVPAFMNQTDLRFRFGFNSSGYGNNPAFAVDNFKVVGNVITDVAAAQEAGAVSVFPNPSSGKFTVLLNRGRALVKAFNTLGEEVGAWQLEGSTGEIDLSAAPAGVYFIRVSSDEVPEKNFKVILSR
jgi:hypothetical protein